MSLAGELIKDLPRGYSGAHPKVLREKLPAGLSPPQENFKQTHSSPVWKPPVTPKTRATIGKDVVCLEPWISSMLLGWGASPSLSH